MRIRCNSSRIYHQMDCLATIWPIDIVGILTIQCMSRIQLDHGNVGTNNRSICCVANKCVSAVCSATVDSRTEKSLRLFLFQLKEEEEAERIIKQCWNIVASFSFALGSRMTMKRELNLIDATTPQKKRRKLR